MPIKTLVLDFDGTCTDIPAAHQKFLDASFAYLSERGWFADPSEWDEALAAVRKASPEAGWTLGTTPSAPGAADPYILAGEAALWVGRKHAKQMPPDYNAYGAAYAKAEAPFRPELRRLLEGVDAREIEIHFVSNSSTGKINGRLGQLLGDAPDLRGRVAVRGGAAKFAIVELPWDDATISAQARDAFEALPLELEVHRSRPLRRPMYLRRGSYMKQLAQVWKGDPSRAATTLVCGDIYELDLALPAALGCAVHLIERAKPYDTYDYERKATLAAARGSISLDLDGLLARIDAL